MHKRSFGWITIKIHNKIKYLKVPTYELPIGELVNTMRHERIELHITTRVSWILEPFLLAGDKERWKNSGLHDCLAIILLHADIREIADLQGINQITEINVVSPLLQFFFQFVESELHTCNVVQKNAIETGAGDLPERLFHEFLSMAGIEVPLLSFPKTQSNYHP